MMLRFSPARSDVADDIDSIITPPFKSAHWSTTDTPSTGSKLDGSFTESEVSHFKK